MKEQFEFYLNQLHSILSYVLFTYGEYEVTVGEVLFVPSFLIVSIVFLRWLGRVIFNRILKEHAEPDVAHLFRRIYNVLSLVVLFFITLELINVPLTAFAFVSGAIAIGVGFGAQNIINNFISGWILMWERPIRIGDFLEIDNVDKGKVESINTRSTRIRRVDGVHMLIPNSKLLENTVVNWTLRDNNMRTSVSVGVAYGSPARKVADLIEQATKEQSLVKSEPLPIVIFEDFGDSALIFEVFFWVSAASGIDVRVVRSSVRFRIDELFKENDIVIAFPQRDIHLDGSLTINSQEKLNGSYDFVGSSSAKREKE